MNSIRKARTRSVEAPRNTQERNQEDKVEGESVLRGGEKGGVSHLSGGKFFYFS